MTVRKIKIKNTMKKTIHILLTCWLLTYLSGCVANKPYGTANQLSTNQEIKVTNAHYRKKATPVGVGLTIGMVAGGAAAGANMDLVTINNSEGEQESVPVANAIIGGLVGWGVSSLFTHVFQNQGQKNVPIDNNQTWTKKKYGEKYIVAGNESEHTKHFSIFPRSAVERFTIQSMEDIEVFKQTFPAATKIQTDFVASQAVSKVNRTDLLRVRVMFPNSASDGALKAKYLEKSNSVAQIIEAKRKFPELKSQAESKVVNYINTFSHVKAFKQAFPNSKYKNEVMGKVVNKLSRSELLQLISLYTNEPNTIVAKKRYITTANNLTDYLSAVSRFRKQAADVERTAKGFVRSSSDLKTFKSQFGRSSTYFKQAFVNAYTKDTRSNIPSIISTAYHLDSLTLSKAKLRYVERSTTVKDAYNAGRKYPEMFSKADARAASVATTVTACNSYFNYFSNGSYQAKVDRNLANALREEYNQLGSLLSYHNFFKKYKDQRDPELLMFKVIGKLMQAEQAADASFNSTYNYKDRNNVKVLIGFQTKGDYPAYLFMDKAKTAVQVIDWFGPWVEAIYSTGARGNWGLIAGKWYKKGTSGDWSGKQNSELKQFMAKAKRALKKSTNGIVIDLIAEYEGSHAADAYLNSAQSYSGYDDYGNDDDREESNADECGNAKEGNIVVPEYDTEDWVESSNITDGIFSYQEIDFDDGVSGKLFRGGDTKKYFISSGLSNYYYKNYTAVVKALYIYKKCGVFTDAGEE